MYSTVFSSVSFVHIDVLIFIHYAVLYSTQKLYMTSNEKTQGVYVGYGYGGFRDTVGIPMGFSVGIGWVWGLKSNP